MILIHINVSLYRVIKKKKLFKGYQIEVYQTILTVPKLCYMTSYEKEIIEEKYPCVIYLRQEKGEQMENENNTQLRCNNCKYCKGIKNGRHLNGFYCSKRQKRHNNIITCRDFADK